MNELFDRLQLRVEASDGGSPAQTATSMVTITINRNLNTPTWTKTSYVETIPETFGLGVSILRVTATDADTKVRRFETFDAFFYRRRLNFDKITIATWSGFIPILYTSLMTNSS